MTPADFIFFLLLAMVAILFALWYCTHQILGAISELSARLHAIGLATRLLAGIVELDKTGTSEIIDQYARDKAESRL